MPRRLEIERTIKLGVHRLADVDLSSLCRYKADETSPLLHNTVSSGW